MKAIPIAIIVVFTLFIGYIGQFIYRSMQKDVELVSANYYQQELDFQDKIEMKKRSIEPNKSVSILYSSESISLDFGKQNVDSYLINLYNSTDKDLDKAWKGVKPSNKELVNVTELVAGRWRCTLYYIIEGTEYMKEITFNK